MIVLKVIGVFCIPSVVLMIVIGLNEIRWFVKYGGRR